VGTSVRVHCNSVSDERVVFVLLLRPTRNAGTHHSDVNSHEFSHVGRPLVEYWLLTVESIALNIHMAMGMALNGKKRSSG
jgi:hypothetical protein